MVVYPQTAVLRLSGKAVVIVFCSRDAVARKCWNSCFEKNPWWCTFLILANKARQVPDSLQVIFSNVSEQLFYKTPPDSCFWKVFSSKEVVARKC